MNYGVNIKLHDMNTVLKNINEIIAVKNELKGILTAIGMNPSDNFEEYADNFITALENIQIQSNNILNS